METDQVIAEILDLFDKMLVLAEAELAWFDKNSPGNGDTDSLLKIAEARGSLMKIIDEKLLVIKEQNADLSDDRELNQVIQKIMEIDKRMQTKAQSWMHDLKGKMQQGNTIRKANRAYGGDVPNYKPAFFDGKR